MIKTKSVKAVIVAVTILSLVVTMYGETILALKENEYISENLVVLMDDVQKTDTDVKENKPSENSLVIEFEPMVAKATSDEEIKKAELEAKMNEVVYEGLTLRQLSEKLDKSLNSTLSGKGYLFASKAIELGIDPYLAVAIVMHETGCKWECSTLVKSCNNVGGMKGPGCEGSSYAGFATLDEGIEAYMNNLYNNFISKGLVTADAMGSRYAASNTWASNVNEYINEIRAN